MAAQNPRAIRLMITRPPPSWLSEAALLAAQDPAHFAAQVLLPRAVLELAFVNHALLCTLDEVRRARSHTRNTGDRSQGVQRWGLGARGCGKGCRV